MLTNFFKNSKFQYLAKEVSSFKAIPTVYIPTKFFANTAEKDLERLEKFNRYDRDNLKSHRWLPYDPEHTVIIE